MLERSAARVTAVSRSASERLAFIDALRGFALFGVFSANLLIFSGISYMTDQQRAVLFATSADSFVYGLERFFIENKFMGLFSLLFGVSFWLFLDRARSRGVPATGLFYRRVFWLFLIGLAHGWLLWCFDILRFYALWALLLPLSVRVPPRSLVTAALFASIVLPAAGSGIQVMVATPALPAPALDRMALAAFSAGTYRDVLVANWRYDWYLTNSIGQIGYQAAVFGRLLLGLYVARTLDLGNLALHRRPLGNVLFVGAIAGITGSAVFAGEFLAGGHDPFVAVLRRLLVEAGHLGLTLAYASGLALLSLGASSRSVIARLAPIGRMALTCYLLQTALGIWLFYGFAAGPALMGRVSPRWLLLVAVAGFALQVFVARAWLRRFQFGPAEWVWRSLTYWRIQPFRVRS